MMPCEECRNGSSPASLTDLIILDIYHSGLHLTPHPSYTSLTHTHTPSYTLSAYRVCSKQTPLPPDAYQFCNGAHSDFSEGTHTQRPKYTHLQPQRGRGKKTAKFQSVRPRKKIIICPGSHRRGYLRLISKESCQVLAHNGLMKLSSKCFIKLS